MRSLRPERMKRRRMRMTWRFDRRRRRFLQKAGAAAAAAALGPLIITDRTIAQTRTLYVNSWGGSFTAAHAGFCSARRRRARRSALSAGHRPRVQEARPDQTAHQGVVAGGQSIATARPRWRGRYDVDLEWTRKRAEGGGRAGRAGLERRGP